MTMSNRSHDQNRQDRGQPSGGQFATEAKDTDTGVDLLGQLAASWGVALPAREAQRHAEARERAEVALAVARDNVHYAAEQEYVAHVRTVVRDAHSVSMVGDAEGGYRLHALARIGADQTITQEQRDEIDDITAEYGPLVTGGSGDFTAAYDPDGRRRPSEVVVATPEGTLDAYPLAMSSEGRTQYVETYATEAHRDAALVDMARNRFDMNPYAHEYTGPEPTTPDTAREFIAWDEPDATLGEF